MDGQSEEPSSRQTAQTNAQNLTDRALKFLSTASNETLAACVLGLGAVTYLVLGRIGLLLIGVVCGVALHATWDGSSQNKVHIGESNAERQRRKEVSLDVIHRVLDWREEKEGSRTIEAEHNQEIDVLLSAGKTLDFREFQPATSAALTGLVDAVIRDYVK